MGNKECLPPNFTCINEFFDKDKIEELNELKCMEH
jgi:hypothetical protein